MFLGMCGQELEAALTACMMLASCNWVLQYALYGVSTFAHSVSQDVGRPSVHADAAFVQHAELTSAVQAVQRQHVVSCVGSVLD